MAPAARYDTPAVQLRKLAAEARAAGEEFEVFWLRAVRPGVSPIITTVTTNPPAGVVRWPSNLAARLEWLGVVLSVKESWRRAYLGLAPSASDRAWLLLSGEIELSGLGDESAAHVAA